MTIPRPAILLTLALGLTSACAAKAPVQGPDPVAVRTTIEAQIAQSPSAISGADSMVTALERR
jgi:hypothetical protein